MTSKNRITERRQVKAGDLLENPRNWRTHPEAQRSALTAVLEEVGIAGALVGYETEDGLRLIDGHLRKEQDPEQEWPVLVLDVDDLEADKLLVTMDPLAAMADANEQVLADLIDSIDTDSDDLRKMLDDLASDNPLPTNGDVVEDEVPEPPVDPTTKPGDLIQLGDHRVLCGDSTNADDVARLMDGETAGMMVTDPPYGVKYDESWRSCLSKDFGGLIEGTLKNDDRSDWSEAFALSGVDVAYVWHASSHAHTVRFSLEGCGYQVRQQIVWVKPFGVMARSAYNRQLEPCWYAVKNNATAKWIGGHKETTVWECNIPNHPMSTDDDTRTDHPTQKPIGIISRAIKNHDAAAVYDPFLGSGTTLIACEQLNRRCYGLEISPAYCDVIVQRWENLTSETASRQSLEAML